MAAWDRSNDELLRKMWVRGDTISSIAKDFSCSLSMISVNVGRLKLEKRYAARSDYFISEARRRGISTVSLERLLIRTILNEKMVTAVLDDEDELKARSQHEVAIRTATA